MTDFSALGGAPLPMIAQRDAPAALTRAPSATPLANEEVRRAAEEFESMFLSEMMGPMFEGLDTEGLGGGGMGEQIFRPMLVEQYAKAISQAGGIGLADSIVAELNRLQAAQAPAPQESQDGADRR